MSDAIYPYHMGGKEVRYHHLCPRLARQGFDVHVFTMHWWDGPRRQTIDGVQYTAVSRNWPLYAGDRRSISQALFFALGCLRLLWHRFDAIEADHMPYLPLFPLRLVATVKRVPLIVTWHEVWGDDYWRQYLGRAGGIASALERAAARLPDEIIAVAGGTKARLIDLGVPEERVKLLPNGVDLALITAAQPAATAYDLVFVGRLIEHKRVADLLEAIGLLAAHGELLTCAIVGTGPDRDRLEGLAEELGIAGHVRFLGGLEHHDSVYGLMKSAQLFVLPSVREGFGIVVVEALACGVPVITSDHPDNQARLLVEDGVTGCLSKPDGASLAATIRGARRRVFDLTRAEETLEMCDWDRLAEQLAGFYLELGRAA